MPSPQDKPKKMKYKMTITLNSGHQTIFYCVVVPSDWNDGTSKWMEGDVWRHVDAAKKGTGKYKFLMRRSSIDIIEQEDL